MKGLKMMVLFAGVSGAALTLGQQDALAAPDSDWDRLAQCESGGNWHTNTGNGFHGGLQFHPQTWTSHGGGEFAPTADQASREQQIVVAERVLASQGWGAWPACSAQLGLNSAPEQRNAPAAAPAPVAPAAPAPVADKPLEMPPIFKQHVDIPGLGKSGVVVEHDGVEANVGDIARMAADSQGNIVITTPEGEIPVDNTFVPMSSVKNTMDMTAALHKSLFPAR